MMRPIAISLSPNTELDDFWLALMLLFSPWQWKRGQATKRVEKVLADLIGAKYAFAFNSGRSAELAIMKALGIGPGDEVLIQAFTCVAVPNSIVWVGANPVFCDIDENFNIDVRQLVKKISPKTRAVIVQHTLGTPANIREIAQITKENGIWLIEDCAHALGAKVDGKNLGKFGDVAFFSFGRDKVVSSVFGGMVVTDNEEIAQKIKRFQKKLEFPPNLFVFQQLLHPILFHLLILPTYNAGGLGKALLVLFQKLGLLSKAVFAEEKKAGQPRWFPTLFPNALATLAINQLAKLRRYNQHRQGMANFYFKELKGLKGITLLSRDRNSIYLRFPFLTDRSKDLYIFAKHAGIILGNWYEAPVSPKDVAIKSVGYQPGSCPKAENASARIINLPTYPTLSLEEAERVVALVKEFFKND